MQEKYLSIQTIGSDGKASLVQSLINGSFYVKKVLDIYEKNVYRWLVDNPINGVPVIREIYEENNKLVVIEEYVSGSTLDVILEEKDRLNEADVRELIIEICKILKDITDLIPMVHRDIKPSNIIVKDNGEVYIIDFNTAKITYESKSRDTVLLGTQGYAAPEQYGFSPSSVRTDIYALGVLMKEMLTGNIDLNENYESKLKSIIDKCTMMEPKQRYGSYEELIAVLEGRKYNKWKNSIVGFRKGNPVYMIIASIWYLIILLIMLTMTVDGVTGFKLILERIFIGTSFFMVTQFTGNFKNCHSLIGISKIKNKMLRYTAIFFVDYGILVLMVLLMAILESFL